jgi:hypothetical protein
MLVGTRACALGPPAPRHRCQTTLPVAHAAAAAAVTQRRRTHDPRDSRCHSRGSRPRMARSRPRASRSPSGPAQRGVAAAVRRRQPQLPHRSPAQNAPRRNTAATPWCCLCLRPVFAAYTGRGSTLPAPDATAHGHVPHSRRFGSVTSSVSTGGFGPAQGYQRGWVFAPRPFTAARCQCTSVRTCTQQPRRPCTHTPHSPRTRAPQCGRRVGHSAVLSAACTATTTAHCRCSTA